MKQIQIKQPAWKMDNTIDISGCQTTAEAIALANMDFTVEKRPLMTYSNESFELLKQQQAERAEVEGYKPIILADLQLPKQYFATVRTDTQKALGPVGSDYKVIQNGDAFAFIDDLRKTIPGIQYETAGVLGNGERVFITVKMPDDLLVGKDDLIKKYLFITTSHDGSGSMFSGFTPMRIFCGNLLNAASRGASLVRRIRHTQNAEKRIEEAVAIINLAAKRSTELNQVYNHWAKVRITDPKLKELIRIAIAPNKETLDKIETGDLDNLSTLFVRTVDKVYEYAMEAENQQVETCKGTAFGAFNAVSGYFQNVRTYKSQETKINSMLYGGIAQQRLQRAFHLCETFAASGEIRYQWN